MATADIPGVKELWRGRLNAPVWVMPGDTLSLVYNSIVVAQVEITKAATYENGVIFECEAGVFGEGGGIGGAFLE